MKTETVVIGVRLSRKQVKLINERVANSPLLDQSKFIRLAVAHLLRSDLGQVLAEELGGAQ